MVQSSFRAIPDFYYKQKSLIYKLISVYIINVKAFHVVVNLSNINK